MDTSPGVKTIGTWVMVPSSAKGGQVAVSNPFEIVIELTIGVGSGSDSADLMNLP